MLKKITVVLLILMFILLEPLVINANKINEYKDKQQEAEEDLENVKDNKSAVMKEIQSLSDSIVDNEEKLSKINCFTSNVVAKNSRAGTGSAS